MSVNKTIMIGNVCSDIKSNTFQGGGKCVNFRLAINEREYKTSSGRVVPEHSDFFGIVANNNLADIVEKYIPKGTRIYIEGKLRNRSYEVNGEKKYVTEIVAEKIEILSSKKDSQAAPSAAAQPVNITPAAPVQEDEDLPF